MDQITISKTTCAALVLATGTLVTTLAILAAPVLIIGSPGLQNIFFVLIAVSGGVF